MFQAINDIGVRTLSDTWSWGAVTFLPEKFTQILNASLLKLGYKRTQIARSRKTNSFTIYCEAGNFPCDFNFADFSWIFQVSQGNKSRIWISDFTRGNYSSWISCTVFEKNKNGNHMVVRLDFCCSLESGLRPGPRREGGARALFRNSGWSFSKHCLQRISLKFSV